MYPLFDTKNENELNNKTRYIINFFRERDLIYNKGTKNNPQWVIKKQIPCSVNNCKQKYFEDSI